MHIKISLIQESYTLSKVDGNNCYHFFYLNRLSLTLRLLCSLCTLNPIIKYPS